MRLFGLFVISLTVAFSQIQWLPRSRETGPNTVGAALNGANLYTWGDGLWQTNLRTGKRKQMSKSHFGRAGCLWNEDLILHQLPDQLVLLKAPGFRKSEIIDTEAAPADCLDESLLGKRGVLITHRGMQVRFYSPPVEPRGRWDYREIYSFYTASFQAGLVRFDVNGDGFSDLFSGNYWIESPKEFALPWHLYAINTYNEQPQSAHARLAVIHLADGKIALLVSQAVMHPARLALFTPTSDVRQLWTEQRLDADLNLNQASSLAVADLDKDGLEDFVLAERGGSNPRLWWWQQTRDAKFIPHLVEQGRAIQAVIVTGPGILAVGAHSTIHYAISR